MSAFLRFTVAITTFALLTASAYALTGTPVASVKVDQAPIIDGSNIDKYWDSIPPIPVKDTASGAVLLLRSVYTDDKVFFSVWVPDKAQNPLHKPWIWNKEKGAYETGPHREDTFVFKWSMMDEEVDLANFSDDNYTSDVWYWKANRTNPAGYADDKSHVLSDAPSKNSIELTSVSGKKRHLSRICDSGNAAFSEIKNPSPAINLIDRYPPSTPDGSRADVRAKGQWRDGIWFIEFERSLATGNSDDVQFDVANNYLFGVSIFSLYGEPHEQNSPNLYGRGRISEPLVLSFK